MIWSSKMPHLIPLGGEDYQPPSNCYLMAHRGMMGAAGAVSAPADISHTDNDISSTNETTVTYSGQAYGAAVSDRIIIAGFWGRSVTAGALTASSCTLGGVSGTNIAEVTSGDNTAVIFQAAVPSGTTGDSIIVWSKDMDRGGCGIWRLVNATSTAHQVGTSSANPGSFDLDIPANGAAMGIACDKNSSTFTWTNLTEDFDEVVESALGGSGASDDFATEQTNLTITAQASSALETAMCVASWGP